MFDRKSVTIAAAIALTVGISSTAHAIDYFRTTALAGKPYHWQIDSSTNTRWPCFAQFNDKVTKRHDMCPQVQTWQVIPNFKNVPAGLGYFFASVDGQQGWVAMGNKICFSAFSFNNSGVYHATAEICPTSNSQFSTSLGGLYVTTAGTVLVFGIFESGSLNFVQPFWRSVMWNYN
jgi:hypothetical protein